MLCFSFALYSLQLSTLFTLSPFLPFVILFLLTFVKRQLSLSLNFLLESPQFLYLFSFLMSFVSCPVLFCLFPFVSSFRLLSSLSRNFRVVFSVLRILYSQFHVMCLRVLVWCPLSPLFHVLSLFVLLLSPFHCFVSSMPCVLSSPLPPFLYL